MSPGPQAPVAGPSAIAPSSPTQTITSNTSNPVGPEPTSPSNMPSPIDTQEPTPDPVGVSPTSAPTPAEPPAMPENNGQGGEPGNEPPVEVGSEGGGGSAPAPTLPSDANSICPDAPGTPPSGAVAGAELVWEVDEMDYDFHLYEGPAWTDGALFFSDINPSAENSDGSRGWNSTIYRFDPASGTAALFLEGAGTNGLAVSTDGTLYSATPAKQEISRYALAPAMQEQVYGGMLNSPNDITVASDGTIYFSDPQQGELPAGGQPQVVHALKDGVDSIFNDTIQSPNGVLLSIEEDALYVTGGGSSVSRVEIVDGQAGDVQEVVSNLSTPDGLAKDCLGNLYIAEHNAVQVNVVSPDGAPLATIPLGSARNQEARPTNVAFGGSDRKTLYVTASYSLWKVELDVAGYPN